jgi:inward rectifier potassium channel
MLSTKTNRKILRDEEMRDLGFGSIVSHESRRRLLNRDGTFNVTRTGLNFWTSLSLYHSLLTMKWWRFLALVTLFYVSVNIVFATAYMLCGSAALDGPPNTALNGEFLRAFFFSVQTFATIGYGHVSPVGLAANLIVTLESLFGLLGFALATGLLFARFSRPTAKIIFSRNAVIAPYHGINAFEFRITNARSNQIIEVEAKVLFSRFELSEGRSVRRFYPLPLERDKVAFLPLSWTIVHPIDDESPLHGLTEEHMHETNAEFLILLTGIDETFSQTVHTRSSYKAEEMVWDAKFSDIYRRPTEDGELTADIRLLHSIERVAPESRAIAAPK